MKVTEREHPCAAVCDQRVARNRRTPWFACSWVTGTHRCDAPSHHPVRPEEHYCRCGYVWPALRQSGDRYG